MAEHDLEFTAGVAFDTGALTAEMQRLSAMMQQTGAALNLQGPIEAAGAAARRVAQDFRAVGLELVNITKSAETVGQQYIAQQAALKKVEAAIRTISQLPITTQKQYDALLALEALQARLQRLTKNSTDLDLNTPQKLATAMAGVTTQMARFQAELQGVAQAQAQVATLGEAMRVALSSRIPVDPSYIATLAQIRETIGQVGPLGQAAFGQLELGIAKVGRELGAATQMELNFNAALERNQRESMKVAAAYDTIAKSLQSQDRIAEAAGIRQARRLEEIIRLQARVAALPVTAQSTAISGQLAGMQGPGQNPVLIAELRAQILQLEVANNIATASAKKLAAEIDASGNAAKRNVGAFAQLEKAVQSLGSRIQRQTEFILAAAASYAAFNTLSAVVTHVVALDEAMHRISATIDDQEDKARLLPRTYALIQQGMTQFGQSTEDAGKLVLELTRSLGDLTQINAAFLPALALTVRGEVNMADATKVLIGSVNAFGAELIGATDPLEAYGLAADKIIRASNLSVGSIGTFSVALTNLAGRASVTNTTFSETLAALSLVQDSLGRAGQSGTGLARVFEGLLLHANQLADIFDIAFDPARAVNPIDLLTKTFAKLREEIKLTGGVSSETEAKIQKIIGTEQGTRIIELLIKDWEKFPARLKAISDSSGQHLRELKEHNEQLGVSFTNLANSALVAFDTILIAFAKLGGASGGTPGQFTTLAQAFNIIAAGAIQFGKDIDRAVEGIKQFAIALANMRPPPSWLATLVGAPSGTPAESALTKVATDIDKVGKALSFLPDPPDWLMRMLGLTASVAAGFLLGGPIGASIGLLTYQVSQYAIDAKTAQDAADKLATSANAAARAMAIQAGHDPAAIGDQAAEAALDVERVRQRMLKERLAFISELETKSKNEIDQANGLVSIYKQIGAARANAAKSEEEYQQARAKVLEAQKLSNLGEKDQAAGLEKLAGLKKKAVTDQKELNSLETTLAKNRQADGKEAAELLVKQAELVANLTKEYEKATASSAAPFQDLSMEQAGADIAAKIAVIKKDVKDKFSGIFEQNVTALITQTVIAQLTSKQQAIVDALVTPYRDAAELSITEIDKVIERVEYLARQRDKSTGRFLLSPEARTEVLAAPARAVDIKLGTDVAEKQLKSLTAAFNLFGEEAAAATFAGSKGFESFSAMVTAAGVAAEYAGAHGLQAWIDGFLRFRGVTKEINLQQLKNDIAATAKAIEDSVAAGGDPARILANAEAWKVYKKSLADLEISADGAERAVAALLVTSAQKTIEKGQIENLNAQLNTLNNTNAGLTASFGQVGAAAIATQLAYQLQGKSVGQLTAEMQVLVKAVAEATQKQKELADTGGLQKIGFSPEVAASMAATLSKQDEINKQIDQGTDALKRWNTQAETAYARNLELVKQTAVDTKDYFSFLAASFEQGATAGHSMFEDLDTLAKNTANNMRTAFSDIFFATLTNNMKDAQSAFKNFFLSIVREISNLMASQAVKGFLGLFGIQVKGGEMSLSSGGLLGNLFNSSGGSPVGQPGGMGTSDITRPTSSSMNSAGFMQGEAGGDPFSAVKMGQAATSLLDAGKALKGSSDVWNAISAGWQGGEGLFGGIQGAATQGFAAMSKAFTGMTAVAAYAAAAIQTVLTIMDPNKSNLGKAIQTATLAVGAGFAWATAGLSLVAAGIINWIEDLFGLFKKGISSYTQKRVDALGKANEGLQDLAKLYEKVATTGDSAQFLGGLRSHAEAGAGAGRGASTIFLATPEMAANLGLKVDPRNMQDGKFEVSWSDVTQAQFDRLLELLSKDENLIPGIVGGRVSVDYLTQDKVGEAEARAAEIGTTMIKAFVGFLRVRNEITKLTDEIQDSVKDFLSEDLAKNFKERLLDPIREKIIALVGSGLPIDKITAGLENFKATLAAYMNLVGLYGQLTQDFAMYSGDFTKALSFVNEQVDRSRQTANKNVVKAAKDAGIGPDLVDAESGNLRDVEDVIGKVQQAFKKMDLTPVQAFEKLTALRTAIIERFELEKKLVMEAEAGIQKLYTEHVTGILALDQAMAQMQIASSGSYQNLQDIILGLINLSQTSLSVSEALYTAGAALRVFIEGLPGLIAGKGGRPDDPTRGAGALPVDQILNATLAVVTPFAATLNQQIRNAFDAGDFEAAFNLLQQLGAGLKAAMDAAIAGVRQWEQAQISIINNEADRRIREAGKVRDMYQRQLDGERKLVELKLKGIQDQKDAIQEQKWAIEDQITAIKDAMQPLEDQIKAINRQQELLRRTMRPIDQAIRGITELMRPLQAQVAALDRQAAALQRTADDKLWNIGLHQYALELERDTIQEQIDLIEEMANAVKSVRDYLHELALSQQAPPDAVGQFQLAKNTFDQLFADYKKDPTAAGLGNLQKAAQDLFGSMGNLFERPSTEYKALYEEIVRKLEKAAKKGETIGSPATLDDLQKQLKVVNDHLEKLNKHSAKIQHQLDLDLHAIELLKRPLDDQLLAYQDQIDALNLVKDGIQHQIDLLEDQKLPIQDQIDIGNDQIDILNRQLDRLGRAEELLSRQETTLNRDLARIADNQDTLNQLYQDYVDGINEQREEAITATEKAADAIVDSIEKAMMPLMVAVGTDAHLFYEWMRNEQYARLMDLTSGQGTAAWMKVAQENTARWIEAVKIALEGFLAGDMRTVTAAVTDKSTDERLIETLTNLDTSIGNLNNYLATAPAPGGGTVPDPNNPPPQNNVSAAEGAWNVAPGTYDLHANEMVLPRAQAEALRASADNWAGISRLAEGGGTMSITIAPVIYSNQNPTAIVNQVVDRIVVDIRGGGAIQDAIARMPKRSR